MPLEASRGLISKIILKSTKANDYKNDKILYSTKSAKFIPINESDFKGHQPYNKVGEIDKISFFKIVGCINLSSIGLLLYLAMFCFPVFVVFNFIFYIFTLN